MKRPFHPFAFALFPLLSLAAANIGYADPADVVVAVALVAGFVALVYLGLAKLIKDTPKAALICSLAFLLFFSFGHVAGLQDRYPLIFRQRYVIPAYWLLFIVLIVLAWRIKKPLQKTTGFMNFLGSALIAVTGLSLATSCAAPNSTYSFDHMLASDDILKLPQTKAPENTRPDVYYIILDGYARADVIKQAFGYDNRGFIGSLRQLGFQVPAGNHTNYTKTDLSLPSSLNLSLLSDNFSKEWHRRYGDLTELVQNATLLKFFKAQGYRVIAFNSGNGFTRTSKVADQVLSKSNPVPWMPSSAYPRAVLEGSMLKPFMQWSAQEDQRRTTEFELSSLKSLPSQPGPKMVFCHILCPHDPYVFKPDGSKQKLLVDSVDGYRGNLEYLSGRVLEAVQSLIKDSANPPIIVVQGDHGWCPETAQGEAKIQNWTRNFIAIYSPGRKAEIRDDITPVNIWRTLISAHFGIPLAQSPDKVFYIRPDHPLPAEVPEEEGPTTQ